MRCRVAGTGPRRAVRIVRTPQPSAGPYRDTPRQPGTGTGTGTAPSPADGPTLCDLDILVREIMSQTPRPGTAPTYPPAPHATSVPVSKPDRQWGLFDSRRPSPTALPQTFAPLRLSMVGPCARPGYLSVMNGARPIWEESVSCWR